MDQEKRWYAVYTRPRWEKKSDGILLRKGIKSWCPTQKVERYWSDRKKIIEEPLFRSYVFVYINEEERVNVLMTEGIINFVYYLGEPAIIRDEEIENIKSYLSEKDAKISLIALEGFKEDTLVSVKHGVFMNNTGTVIRGGKKKVYVRLESLGQVMVVEFPTQFLNVIDK